MNENSKDQSVLPFNRSILSELNAVHVPTDELLQKNESG